MIHADEILDRIKPGDRVLDVGGWASPFNRADWVIDLQPYETRGYYGKVGLPASQGGEREYFTRDTWITRDLCDREPWPFPDKWFDFSICSHTLEDIRDPLFVCSELIRVSKRGYIETPSRLAETCRGWFHERIAGLSHHHWLIDYGPNRLDFTMKLHVIHADRSYTLPPRLYRDLTVEEQTSWMFWEDRFDFAEKVVYGRDMMREFLGGFVAKVAADPRFQGLAPDDPFEDQVLREQLEATQAELSACRDRLAQYEELNPLVLGLARRLRGVSRLIPPLARLSRSRRSA